MLALFLSHSPIFVAGEITLGLSLALFFVALIAAVCEQARSGSRFRSFSHPNSTIVGRLADDRARAPLNVARPVLATRPLVRSGPRRS